MRGRVTLVDGLSIERVDREDFPWVVKEPHPQTIGGWTVAVFIREEDARSFVDSKEIRGRLEALAVSYSEPFPRSHHLDTGARIAQKIREALNPPKEGT